MQLSKRLKTIADLVPEGCRLVDVGTDHGYIPIYLNLHQPMGQCIASDINKGPLESAKRNMGKYNLTNIELRQGSGLQTVSKEDEMEVVVIAGMGGYLVHDILEKDLELVKTMKRLILQPQNNIPEIRRYVHQIGFRIEKEIFLEEDGKYYTIIVATPGVESYDEVVYYEYGKYLLEESSPLYRSWLTYKSKGYKDIIAKLEDVEGEQSEARIKELMEANKLIEEALECMH
nr:tRNA (adenine(22)-N(1))-methyltransferase TrmK [uncultured Niameybacter sp.]